MKTIMSEKSMGVMSIFLLLVLAFMVCTGHGVTFVSDAGVVSAAGTGGLPKPDYDSGWISKSAIGYGKTLTHSLGGNVDNYFVDVQAKVFGQGESSAGSAPSNQGVGMIFTYDNLTPTSILLLCYGDDFGLFDYAWDALVRVRIWVYDGPVAQTGGEIVVVDKTWSDSGLVGCQNYLPDLGEWAQSWAVNSAPAGAHVTGVSYSVTVEEPATDVTPAQHNFWCSDYEIGLSSTARGGTGNYVLVWDNAGGQTDQNLDDDAADDRRITLSRTTSAFNGQSVNQTWYFHVKDTVSHSGSYKGVGCFTRLRIAIQYQ